MTETTYLREVLNGDTLYIKNVPTEQLLSCLKKSYEHECFLPSDFYSFLTRNNIVQLKGDGGFYSGDDTNYPLFVTEYKNFIEDIKKELSTREHVPNKLERKKIRQKKARGLQR